MSNSFMSSYQFLPGPAEGADDSPPPANHPTIQPPLPYELDNQLRYVFFYAPLPSLATYSFSSTSTPPPLPKNTSGAKSISIEVNGSIPFGWVEHGAEPPSV